MTTTDHLDRLLSARLSRSEQAVLADLRQREDADATYRLVDAAFRTGLHPTSIWRALKRLADAGLVTYEPGRRGADAVVRISEPQT